MSETKTVININWGAPLLLCLLLAFCGEPDLMDGIISNLQCNATNNTRVE